MFGLIHHLFKNTSVRYQALLLVLPFVVLMPFLLETEVFLYSRSSLGSDYIVKQLPNAQFLKQAWLETGQFPRWRPGFMSGVPVAGNPSYLNAYPIYWLILIFPLPWALNFLFALHLALAAVGMFIFAKCSLGLGHLGSTGSAVSYMFAPKVLAHISGGQLDIIIAIAWLPWSFYALVQVFKQFSLRWSWFAGVILGFLFVSHPPTSLLIYMLLIVFGFYRVVKWRFHLVGPTRLNNMFFKGFASFLTGVSGFFVIAGVHLFSMINLLPYLHRTQLSISDATVYALPPAILPLALAVPPVPFPEWIVYIGASVSVFAWFGIRAKNMHDKKFWLVVGFVALVYSLGTATPLFTWAYQQLPGFKLLRVPSRAWFFISFVLAIFCGGGMELFLEYRKRFFKVSAIVLAILIISTYVLTHPVNIWQWLALSAASLSVGTIIVLSQSHFVMNSNNRIGLVLLLIVFLELAFVGWSFWETGEDPVNPIGLDEVRSFGKKRGVSRLYSEGRLTPYIVEQEDWWVVEGLDPVQLQHYVSFIEVAVHCQSQVYSISVPSFLANPIADADCSKRQVDSYLLGLLNVDYALTSQPQEDHGWELLKKVKAEYLYHNKNVRSGAFLANQTINVQDDDEALSKLKGFSAGDPILVEGGKNAFWDTEKSAHSAVEWLDTNSFEVSITSKHPAFIVLSVVYMPGWKAHNQLGSELVVYQTQLGIMGVQVPPGHSKLLFVYDPDGPRIGKGIFVTAAITSLFLLLIFGVRGWISDHVQ